MDETQTPAPMPIPAPAPEVKKRGRPKAATAAAIAAPITCPACKSKIASDGKTLHEKSKYLDELITTDAGMEEVEKNVTTQLKLVNEEKAKLAKENADLRAELDLAKAARAAEKKNMEANSGLVQEGKKQNTGKQRRPSWWD